MGYHKRQIPSGIFGEFSKIQEEFEELLDSHEQGVKILELCEIADLYGAIEGYVKKHFNMSMKDIEDMKCKNTEAFESGERKNKETETRYSQYATNRLQTISEQLGKNNKFK